MIRVKLWMWILMNIVSWSDVQNRPVGLTCHKWKADTTKLKGAGEVDDPNEGVGEADNPNEGVGEVDDLDKVVGELDDPDVALLGLHVCIYKEISCTPLLVLIKRLLQGKDFEKYAHEDSYKEKNSTPRKRGQPFTTIKSSNTLTNQSTHNWPRSSTLELWEVLTWPSEGIWPAPHRCSLRGLLLLLCRCCFGCARTVWLASIFSAYQLAPSVGKLVLCYS